MRIELTTNEFTEVTITSGTLQNISPQASVEVASTATKNTGIIIPPYATLSYSDNATVYARNAWDDDSTCVIAVEPFKRAAEGGGSYTLPVATASKLGGVKIGSNVTVAEDGTISVAEPYSLPTAAANTLGGVKVGSGLVITDGVLSAIGGGGGMSYSTTEQLIGTWIDGKPLYQKTLVKTGGVSDNDILFTSELQNIDYIQKTFVMFKTTDYSYESEYFFSSTDHLVVLVRPSLVYVGAGTTRTVTELYVTVQYTKTTD